MIPVHASRPPSRTARVARPFLLALLLPFVFAGAVRAAEVYTRIDEREIPLQGRTAFTIGIRGATVLPMRPVIRAEGLLIISMGTSQSMTVLNGRMQLEVEWRYRVVGTAPGTHTIPAQEIRVDGRNQRTRPVSVEVLPQTRRPTGPEPRAEDLPPVATDARVTTRLRPERIAQDQVAELVIAVAGDEQPDLELPEIRGVDVVAHPENPRTLRRAGETVWVHFYHLLPYTGGRITIPALDVSVGNRSYRTRTQHLTVTSPQATSAVLMLDGDSVYLGEPVAVDMVWRLPTRILGFDLGIPWYDSHPGFAVRSVEAIDGRPLRNVNEDPDGPPVLVDESRGARGMIWTLRRVLVPLETGTLRIPSARGEIRALPSAGFGRLQPARLQATTAPAELTVRPLPREGRPDFLAGPAPVGQFRVSASAEPAEVAVGEAVELTWRVEGRGNFESVFLGPLEESADLTVYPQESETRIGPDGFEGAKLFRQTLAPKHARVRELPGFRFAYFDPGQEEWRTAVAAPVPLSVHPAATVPEPREPAPPSPVRPDPAPETGAGAAGTTPPAEAEVVPVDGAGELLPVEAVLAPRLLPPHRTWAGRILIGLPLLLLAAALLLRHRESVLERDPTRLRRKRALRTTRERLRSLSADASGIPAGVFFLRAHAVIVDYIADRSDRPAGELTASDVRARLEERSVPAALRDRVADLLEEADRARFDGLDRSVEEREDFLRRTEAVLRELERHPLHPGGSA